VPSQTWPNRAFAHAGTSVGHVNNGEIPDPLTWDVHTIFGVLTDTNHTWIVYSDTEFPPIESLTRAMFPELWPLAHGGNFQNLDQFVAACAANTLPQYSFLEPNFGTFSKTSENDDHPPSDVLGGEAFLGQIWKAVSTSPAFGETLLVITFDEHGGCYDHVLPPGNAVKPDNSPAEEGFGFNRFGVRVPTILVSPYIQPGTVFRSDTAVPLDHTSLLATLRDWLAIPQLQMLASQRVAAAPNLFHVLSLGTPRTDVPQIAIPRMPRTEAAPDQPLNDLQKSILSAVAVRYGMQPAAALAEVATREQAVGFRNKLVTRGAGG
jgi:phospholipase C